MAINENDQSGKTLGEKKQFTYNKTIERFLGFEATAYKS